MKKVLFFVDRLLIGGIQILIKNLLSNWDFSKIQVDILVLDDGFTYPLEKELEQMGVTIYKLDGIWLKKPPDYVTYAKALDNFFLKHHDYIAIHMHSSSKNFFVLKYAKKYNIPIRIAHSHNTGFQTKSLLNIFIGNMLKTVLRYYATDLFACSDYAGKWLFGNAKFDIIKNGVDLQKYCYSSNKREFVRKELGINNQIVIGNVGRFVQQKNHKFMIGIFSELLKVFPNSILLLAGTGELIEQCKKYVEQLGIDKKVMFLGYRSDIHDLLQAMDLFLMPSFFEGFPVTGVEAQACGLPCVFSDTITKEVKLTDFVEYVCLDSSVDVWVATISRLLNNCDRNKCKEILKEKGFDIRCSVEWLQNFYLGNE